MNHEQQGMSDEFASRMRQGLSTMAVRERVRERSRNRAIAGGALAAVVVATVAVFGSQAFGQMRSERDQAGPAVTSTPTPTHVQPIPTATDAPVPSQTTDPDPEPSAPPGFEGIAAGEPIITDSIDCSAGCGNAGAAGGPGIERQYDVYVLCEGSGSVLFGNAEWIDCTEHEPGSGWALLGMPDPVGDGDPQYTSTPSFDGQLQMVARGAVPDGTVAGSTATVYYDCGQSITIGGSFFDCDDLSFIEDYAAWGIAIEPGSFAPRIELANGDESAAVRWVMER